VNVAVSSIIKTEKLSGASQKKPARGRKGAKTEKKTEKKDEK
jgi:hypothetical protein